MVNDDIGDYGRIIIKVFKGEMSDEKWEKKKPPAESNQDDFFAWCFYCHNFCCLPFFFQLNFSISSLLFYLSHFPFCTFLHVVTTLFCLSLLVIIQYHSLFLTICHVVKHINHNRIDAFIQTDDFKAFTTPSHYCLMNFSFYCDTHKIVLIKYDIQIPQNSTLNFISTLFIHPLRCSKLWTFSWIAKILRILLNSKRKRNIRFP